MKDEEAKAQAQIFKAVSHPARILLVESLRKGDKCVMELLCVADVKGSSISRHLAMLKWAGIVTDRREGTKVFYHLQTPHIMQAFDCAMDVFNASVKRRTQY